MQTQSQNQRIDYRDSLSGKEKMVILLGVLLTLFLAALDQTIVGTAQPAIIAQFQGIDLISWVTSGYLLASTAMVPIFGKLSDLYGRKRVLMVGAVIFLIGSALCGTAPSMLFLIIYRVIQGIGAAGITSVAFAIPADLWAPAERAKVSGLITSVFGIAGIVGPFLGGLLTNLSTQMATKLQPIVAELPPAFQGRFDASQLKNGASSEGGEGVPDVGAKIQAEVTKVFAEQRALVTAAIQDGDAAAQAALAASPEVPAELKAIVAPGGLEAMVVKQMGAQWAQAPDAMKAQILAKARAQALDQALAGMDSLEGSLLQQGEIAGVKITGAIKESFAASTTPIYGDAVWVALVSLVVLLFLPELPLSRGKQAAVAVGHQSGSLGVHDDPQG